MTKSNLMPLVKELREIKSTFLDSQYDWVVPNEILKNLVHDLRYYQIEAIEFFHLTQFSDTFKYRNINHVLFHMATGSGKTDLMAGLILYLYREMGYQNFLFTVNTNSVLNKTIENLIDTSSVKYLYKPIIEMDGERIEIKRVKAFPYHQEKNTIYIVLDTIQSISTNLFTQKEGVMGEEIYARNKVVILGDEAHHYSASTKKEKETERSWEYAISTILNVRDDNKLLEFTATIDLENKNIYKKYKDKVIYQYDLSKFMADGYSKNIKRIQSANNDEKNMLNVVLLSEYRRRYALESLGTRIKPVVMFKSQKIDDSNDAEEKFNKLIKNLSVSSVINFIKSQRRIASKGDSNDEIQTLELAYKYYEENKDRLSEIVSDIKREFSPNRIINANDTDRSAMLERGQYEALNSLESPDNLYRAVFAVAKLTEGWDVLNLYDIVRISDPVKTSGTKTQTNSEAQLIGRGARYNPFKLKGKASYKRRFSDYNIPSLLTETLHYHTINEPQYLKNLISSLDDMDLPTGIDGKNPLIDIEVKPSFKRTKLYKEGKIYYNDVVDISDSFYDSLDKYGIDNKSDISINWINIIEEFVYSEGVEGDLSAQLHDIELKFDNRFWTKAFARNSFYHFKELKRYVPQLNSMEKFLGEKWLNVDGGRRFFIRVAAGVNQEDLNPKDKLGAIELYLKEVEHQIRKGYLSKRGTNEFIGYPIKEYITNYRKRVPKYDTKNAFLPQKVSNYDFIHESYVYKNSVLNRTEKQLVDRVLNLVQDLKVEYEDVYLIRMDENMHRESPKGEQLKLHQFQENPDNIYYSGFQPDFILLLVNDEYYIQVFIEPKGEDRYLSEKWKEELLLYLNDNEDNLVIDEEINNTKIKGLKFYFLDDKQGTINQLEEMVTYTKD